MIRHYDMTTGEEVGVEIQDGSERFVPQADKQVSTRLMNVQEDATLRDCDSRLPADMATLPVEIILARWS